MNMRCLFFLCALSAAWGQGYSPWPHHMRFEGVVVDFVTGAPIPDVTVSASHCERKTTTDTAGRFALECPYTIETQLGFYKRGYSDHGVQKPAVEGSDSEGNPIHRQIIHQMWAPTKITGRVIDANSWPVPDVTVSAEPVDATIIGPTAKTDSKGAFSLDVAPGSYRLCAVTPVDSVRERITPADAPGTIAVSACFPAAHDRSHATSLEIKPPENQGPVVIRLPDEPVWSVSGRVRTRVSKTPDWSTQVWAIASPSPASALPSPSYYRGQVDETTGQFILNGLRAGPYTLLVRAGPANQCPTCPMPAEYENRLRLDVKANTPGVTATLEPFSSVTGRVTLVQASPPLPAREPIILDSGLPSRFALEERISARVSETGDFRIESVPPGLYLVAQTERESHFLRTVRMDGRPVVQGQIRIAPGTTPLLEIEYRDAAALFAVRINGDKTPPPAERFSVVAIPENAWNDRSSWAGPIQASNGRRLLIGVPRHGTYFVFATENLAAYPVEAWADALKRHQDQATRVTVPAIIGVTVALKPIALGIAQIKRVP